MDAEECIFIHGSQRRGASDGYQLADLPLVSGSALVRGRLWQVGPSVALQFAPEPDAPWVLGDVYRVDSERLRILDDGHGLPEGSTSSGNVRRVRVEVFPFGSGLGMIAWIWEWTGPLQGGEPVPSGDWLDMEHPRPSPRLTGLAVGCFFVSLVASLIAELRIFRVLHDAAVITSLTSLLVGGFANYFAGRRRERWAPLRPILGIFFVVFGILALYFGLLG